MSATGDRDKLISALEKQGWSIEYGTKHIKVFPPGGGRAVIMSRRPSDNGRGWQNTLSDLRRLGANV